MRQLKDDVDVLLTDCGLSPSTGMYSAQTFCQYDADSFYQFACRLCDKHLSDVETAALHASTEKHKRQLRYSDDSSSSGSDIGLYMGDYDIAVQNVIQKLDDPGLIGRCLLCRNKFSDSYQLLSHVSSKRHRQNLDWYQRVHAAIALGKFISAKDTHPSRNRVLYEDDLYDQIPPPSEFIISGEIASFIRDLPEGVVVREWEYYCSYCDSKTYSDEQIMSHTMSHTHKAVRGLKQIERKESESLSVQLQDTDWESAVRAGLIPPPPLNRRPLHQLQN